MKTVAFRIDVILKMPPRKSMYLLGTLLAEGIDFKWSGNCLLGNSPIKNITTCRALDENGKPLFNKFGVQLKDRSHLIDFREGMTVQISCSDG